MPTHEIPTHLHGADRIVAGCTWSQLFTLGGGAAGAFWAWQTIVLPQIAHAGLCAVPVLIAVACAFWRPDGHGLVTWLGLLAAYAVTPHQLVWQREAANIVLLPAPALPAAANIPTAEATTRRTQALSCGSIARVSAARPSAAPRVVPRTVPARRRGGLLTILLGQRLLCLSTHHLRVAEKERGA